MKKRVAFCDDLERYQGNRLFDRYWIKKFPATVARALLAEQLVADGFSVATGDIAVGHVRSKYWKPEDILVIQDLDAGHGQWLIQQGATPVILTCYESPGYATSFYDRLDYFGPLFPHRFLFSGSFNSFQAKSGTNYPVRYPAFVDEDIRAVTDWDKRDFLVMVAANRTYGEPFFIPLSRNPKSYLRWIKYKFIYRSSRTKKDAKKYELHTKRLEAIEYFGHAHALQLFGPSWNDPERTPPAWRKRLGPVLDALEPQPCQDKRATISNFKFSICFENASYPGYVTEKIIDNFLAGTIPIYLGAPDIADLIPREAFIDRREFDSWQSLHRYLLQLGKQEAMKIISAGRDFLHSPCGIEYNHTFHAERFRQCIARAG